MTFTPEDERLIRAWGEALAGPVRIVLFLDEDDRSGAMEAFCDELQRQVPVLGVEKRNDGTGPVPAVGVSENVRYQAVPAGLELSPFLEALRGHGNGAAPSPGEQRVLDRIAAPALVKIYVTMTCPYCPGTVGRLLPMATGHPFLRMTVIDGSLFPEKAVADGVRAVPTVILDDRFRWTGEVKTDEFLDAAADRDPSRLSPDSLKGLLEDGRAEDLAVMMAERGTVFPAFLDLLMHEKWPIRLGAMVAFEYLLERDRDLSRRLLDGIWDRLAACDDSVQGDMLHLVGETGIPGHEPRLKALLRESDSPQVREAAEEALAALAAHSPKRP